MDDNDPRKELQMANYLLLYHGGKMPEGEAEQKAVMMIGRPGILSLVSPWSIQEPVYPMAKNISSNGNVSDGPAGSMASGYTVIKADTLDAAASMAKSCPVLKGGAQISVFETFNVM
jgi:hypothetical protein